jgi:hypothetical protein
MTEEEQCFNRICEEAAENMQPVPFGYFIDGNNMWCEREGMNSSIYAERINREWIAFFEV